MNLRNRVWASVLGVIVSLCPLNGGSRADEIPLTIKKGVYHVPVRINGVITLQAVLDTGAGDVQVPADVLLTLIRAGTIREDDFLPGATYIMADGSTTMSDRFILRELQIGDRRIEEVTASVGKVEGDILLGHSFLSRLPTWSIDNRRQVLILSEDFTLPLPDSETNSGSKGREASPTPLKSKSGSVWMAIWDNDVLAIASQEACPVHEFSVAGYRYGFLQAIPISRLRHPADSWYSASGRAITVVGCWNFGKDGKVHARMRRKKDGKTWNWSGSFSDGIWQKLQ